jgi:hypothetical protein
LTLGSCATDENFDYFDKYMQNKSTFLSKYINTNINIQSNADPENPILITRAKLVGGYPFQSFCPESMLLKNNRKIWPTFFDYFIITNISSITFPNLSTDQVIELSKSEQNVRPLVVQLDEASLSCKSNKELETNEQCKRLQIDQIAPNSKVKFIVDINALLT